MRNLPDLKAAEWTDIGDGLKIWDAKVGDGTAVQPKQTVKVHYTGWLTDGSKFDSSHDRGQPIEFPLTGVIAGWTKGIPGMQPGGTRRLMIPGPLAYGQRGIPGTIPPDATLVFEVDLISAR
jgi:FKBP-type peptidyl-prolyl cis-trans isomerase